MDDSNRPPRRRRSAVAAAFVALLLCSSGARAAARYNLRWVLVHDHSAAVEQAAKDFAARVEKETAGGVRVEIMTRAQYSKKYGNGKTLGLLSVTQDVASGKLEACQTYTNQIARLYEHGLTILGLPYLFRDYAHAEKVLDGPIGLRMLDKLHELSPLRALAFTYSGGFGVFAAVDREIRAPADLRGLRMLMMRSRIAERTAHELEFEDFSGPPENFAPLARAGLVDGLETTYSCFTGYGDDRYAKVVTDTGHFLLTTMIVINERFFQSLPKDYQRIVQEAAADTARAERAHTIALLAEQKRELSRHGIKIIDLTAEQKEAFVKALEPVLDDLRLGPKGLASLEEIKSVK